MNTSNYDASNIQILEGLEAVENVQVCILEVQVSRGLTSFSVGNRR
jgi:DNA gyrase/topoisomerase IV subunit B